MISRKRRRESAPLLSACSSQSSSAVPKSASSSSVSVEREGEGRRFSFESWLLSRKKKKRLSCCSDWEECLPSSPKSCDTSSPKSCDTKEYAKLNSFVRWCGREGITLSKKVILTRQGSCANIGMVASEDISCSEELARIPRCSVLCARNSDLATTMEKDKKLMKQLAEVSSWVPLLITLVYEWAKNSKDGSSRWGPYLQLVPNGESLEPPMMWSQRERERLLSGTTLPSRVEADLENIEQDYEAVVKPFMERHPNLFSKKLISLQLYHKLVSFVMSYSFTDNGGSEDEEGEEVDVLCKTSMVPVIDLLNHHHDHSAELDFQCDHLALTAVRDIKKGEEVMNTYGRLCNTSLLHMYGFAELGNPHDKGCLSLSTVLEVYTEMWGRKGKGGTKQALQRKKALEDQDLFDGKEWFEVDCGGNPEEELLQLLKLLFAEKKEFRERAARLMTLREGADSSSASSSDAEGTDKYDAMAATKPHTVQDLSREEILCLHSAIEEQMGSFPEPPKTIERVLHSTGATVRERMAAIVCHGQQQCLLALQRALKQCDCS